MIHIDPGNGKFALLSILPVGYITTHTTVMHDTYRSRKWKTRITVHTSSTLQHTQLYTIHVDPGNGKLALLSILQHITTRTTIRDTSKSKKWRTRIHYFPYFQYITTQPHYT